MNEDIAITEQSYDFLGATLLIFKLSLLQSSTLRGWHCTRLTDHEANHISSHGMHPPNLQTLTERIRRVQADSMITDVIAERLIGNNQADDNNRKGMIWFCFFDLATEDQGGIECFFRYWGGEALYNYHERDPLTGEALKTIGRPCLIEAEVPISSFKPYTYLGDKVIRRYLHRYGLDAGDYAHEDYTCDPIPAANIVRMLFSGDPDFATLTGCDLWDCPLDDS